MKEVCSALEENYVARIGMTKLGDKLGKHQKQ